MNTINMAPSLNVENPVTLTASKLVALRVVVSVIGGAIITFGLFVLMQALIAQDNERPIISEAIIIEPFILDIPEEKITKRPPPQPIIEMQAQPPSIVKLSSQTPSTDAFSTDVTIGSLPTQPLLFTIQAADHQPRAIVRVDPRYPARAASNGIEGFVMLSFGVSASGEVVDVDVLESSPRNTFDSAAKQALRKWRYQPKMVGGSSVAMSGLQVRLDFTLAND